MHARDPVIVTRIHPHRHLTGGADGRIRHRRDDLHVGSLVGNHGERQRIREFRRQHGAIRAQRGLGTPSPRPVPIHDQRALSGDALAGLRDGDQGDDGATIAEHGVMCATAQHHANPDPGATRHTQGWNRLQRFVGAAQIGRVDRPQRHVADPSTLLHHEGRREFWGAPVGHADFGGRTHGAEGQCHPAARWNGQERIAPGLPFRARRHRDLVASAGHDAQRHGHAARHPRGQPLETHGRQQGAPPCPHRLQHRGETIGGPLRRTSERSGAQQRRDGRKHELSVGSRGQRGRQRPGRQAARHIVGGAGAKRARSGHFERTAERAFPQSLFPLHGARQRRQHEPLLQAPVTRHEREGGETGRQQSDPQRQRRRPVDPSPVSQQSSRPRQHRGQHGHRQQQRGHRASDRK